MRFKEVVRSASMVAILAVSVSGVAMLRAAEGRSETLVYAVYNGQDTATQVFSTMKSGQSSTGNASSRMPSCPRT
jgi:hypothetical protein